MADYDRRNHGHRGGGGGRKRRYRDDDDFDRRPLRRRYEEPLGSRVRRQLLLIAESPARRVEDDVVYIARMVSDNTDDVDVCDAFFETVIQLTLEQPFKIPFIAAVVLVINTLKPDFAAEVLKKISSAVQDAVTAGVWRDVKLLVRLLGCLQGILEGEGVFVVLDDLFSRAVDLQTTSSEDSLGLELVKIILLTIPYVMASSATGFETQATALLEKTEIIASTPHALEALVTPFTFDSEISEPLQSFIGVLQTQLQNEAANRNWELKCLPRPWKSLELPRKKQAVEGEGEEKPEQSLSLENAEKHALPAVDVPNPVKNGPNAIYPEVYFSVYLEQEIETVPGSGEITSTLLRDTLVDTINILDFNRMAVAKFLIDVDCYFSPEIFVKRATPFDRLREFPSDRPTWKPEDVAVDAVFSQLFQLPAPEHKLVYYHSVLTECCKVAPAAIAPSLGRAIRFLYRNLERFDVDLVSRFLDWFSHHLSNFGFTWKWTEWIDDLQLPEIHPKMAFITGALDKEIRLSFAQRIKGTLPEPYQPLIAEGKEKDTPDFKYTLETTPYCKQGSELMQLIRKKAADEEIEPVIAEIETQAKDHGVEDPMVPSTDAFVTSICYVGSKSLSHVLSCIERNKERLLAIGPRSAPARRQIITSVMEYWVDQPGIAINIIDKLLNYTILTPLSVIEWALLDHIDAGKILAKAHIYEMLSATVGKVTNRIRQIVAARTQLGLYEPQLSVLDETLNREKADMQTLFTLIEDSITPVAAGSNDELMERSEDDPSTRDENEIIRRWAVRWRRVFQRKAAVEAAFVADAMLNATPLGTMPPTPPPVEDAAEEMVMEQSEANGDMDIADIS
ncbi:snRNA cap binding complex subunit (Gcr3), putative [Talaromyces stipitatus ATCC 10500]|uniref:snRNA cap binding complex subunit (Gcr3), putative n=1 Tax=Talaromyces stipitatus (strain ATCC 10500 / CBS 375.48 / QM 6759 / NRRL 1006) TaxID=441959 RepID=B8MTN8_TALSN|nr:snRNA cap binding complex subunit (Gcr3), putative [Talaromyces stipitatus ATCC 10500]EED12523.1 snRNA cap binding complex subunit (Gcr3), putative [Talaromyces stipitatus ATCC 10500]